MCTAASYRTKDLYFGRNLDYEFSYGDEVTITPRNYPFTFRRAGKMRTHYAMIGMAYVAEEYPLYYDAVNEKGLCIAGLNFVGNAACQSETDGKDNISVFELIPWLLGQCADLNEVRALWTSHLTPSCPRQSCTGSSLIAPAASRWRPWPTACMCTRIL